MKKIVLALLFVMLASVATAATTNISGGGTGVLSAAITAATAGDTINITDSATYTETQLIINKVVYITADLGQTPVITNAGNIPELPGPVPSSLGNMRAFVAFMNGSGGTTTANCAKLGSLSGGRITIQYQTQPAPTALYQVVNFIQGNSNYAILENVNIIETGSNPAIHAIQHSTKNTYLSAGYCNEFIKLSYVDIDMGVTNNLVTASNQAIGILSGPNINNYQSSNHETYILDHVRIKNFGTVGISLNNMNALLIMSYCDIGTLGATSNAADFPSSCLQSRNGYSPFTLQADRCIFRAPAVGNAVQLGGGGTSAAYANPVYGSVPAFTSATLTRSVFVTKYPRNASGGQAPGASAGYGPVTFYANGGTWTAARPQQIHFDHCDIVDMTTTTLTNVACFARPASQRANTATSLTVTNCNVYSANNAAFINLANTTSFPISIVENNNNWFGPVASSGITVGAGAGDLSVDPGYLYPEAGDVRYSNTALKTADALGGPIGIDAGYGDIASGTIENKIGVRYAANPTAGGTIDGVTSTTYNINSGDSCPAKTAAVNAHYTWGGWSDSNMSLSRTDTAITSSKIFKANFILDTYTVNYAAAANGEVTGTLSQVIGWNLNGTPVTAIPATGYHFTQWEDALTSNPRTDFNVAANATHTASFAINTYNYNYVAGANGTVNGAASVTGTADHGASGPSVTAAPASGYAFSKWLDNNSTNPTRQDVFTADLTTTATFEALTQFTLTYTAGANGTITGTTPQTVDHGGNGSQVTAVANSNYHFVSWSDGVLTAARTDTNVTANISVTATFAINTHTLTYTAGSNGTISGTTPQTVDHGGNGTQVTAVANSNYHFVNWSDGVLTAARTDTNVTADISVTANFAVDINSIKVPTQYGTIQAAINAAAEGETVEIVNSATYKENLRINKSVNLIATAGQSPKVEQADNTTTCPIILGVTASPVTIQLGSLSGGRITFQYMKWGTANAATMPVGHIYMGVTTGSTVRIENCDIVSTGPTTYAPVTGIAHHQNPCSVTLRYVNMNLNRADYAAGGVSTDRVGCTGIDLSNNSPTGGTPVTRRIPGPTYTLDHVRIKGYVRAGLWLSYTSATLNLNNVDIGTFGENTLIGTANIPWGPVVAFNAASQWTGRIQNSIFQGPMNYPAFGKIGPLGTSITLNRCVLLGSGGTNAAYGTLDAGSQNAGTGSPVRLSLDHCDLVHLGIAPASALVRNVANGSIIMNITNSNIYSQGAQAINLTQIASPSVFNSSYNNVFGATANVGYTAGTGDVSSNPNYSDAAGGDVRYMNNLLKTADSVGGPVGCNGDYGDVYTGIGPGVGVVNRAHGWAVLE
ncbi:hypothetical protein LLG95_16280 [bacterium]|nr:hypothetical protein [bacterium]